MSMERTNVLLRPSLRFISTLPTIKMEETILNTGAVMWKIEPPKPVVIMYDDCPVLNIFYIEAITLDSFSMKIGIVYNMLASDFLVPPCEEEWYLKNKWWDWH